MIENCEIKVTSKTEFKKVEEICFKNNVFWADDEKPINYNFFIEPATIINISKGIRAKTKILTYSTDINSNEKYISFNEFIIKYNSGQTKYRIKTKQEFIDEFGEKWRNRTKNYFNDEMDYLLGKKLTKEETKEFIGNNNIYIPRKIETCNWDISSDMITNYETEKNTIKQIKSFLCITDGIELSETLYKKVKPNLNQNTVF